MTLLPVRDGVLVKIISENETTASGLVVVHERQEDSILRGEVLAVGPGRVTERGILIPPSVCPGDKILFPCWEYRELRTPDESHTVMIKDADILAVEV